MSFWETALPAVTAIVGFGAGWVGDWAKDTRARRLRDEDRQTARRDRRDAYELEVNREASDQLTVLGSAAQRLYISRTSGAQMESLYPNLRAQMEADVVKVREARYELDKIIPRLLDGPTRHKFREAKEGCVELARSNAAGSNLEGEAEALVRAALGLAGVRTRLLYPAEVSPGYQAPTIKPASSKKDPESGPSQR